MSSDYSYSGASSEESSVATASSSSSVPSSSGSGSGDYTYASCTEGSYSSGPGLNEKPGTTAAAAAAPGKGSKGGKGGKGGKGSKDGDKLAGGAIMAHRKCTDVFFLILFGFFWIGMGITMVLAFNNGNPEYLLYGIDSFGNICGEDNRGDIPNGVDMRSRDYLFFGNPLDIDQAQICVPSCPVRGVDLTTPDFDNVYCIESFTGTKSRTNTFGLGCLTNCPCFAGYNSDSVMRRCIPGAGVVAENASDNEVSRVVFSDLYESRWIVLACVGIAFVLAFVWLIVIRYAGGCLVWTTVVGVMLLAIAVTAFMWVEAFDAKNEYDEASRESNQGSDASDSQYKVMLALAIAASVGVLILFVVLIFMFPKIRMAIELIEEATYAMADMPCMLAVPVIIFVILLGFFAVWTVGAVFLATAGDRTFDENNAYQGIEDEGSIKYYQMYWFFGLLWVTAFFLAMSEMIMAGAVASWYFRGPNNEYMPDYPVASSARRTLTYHLGTLAFGSFIIAVVQFIRAMIKMLEESLKDKQNAVLKFVFSCIQYMLACVERFLKFISRNAYIMTAIDGTSFCVAARDAFNLLLRYAVSLVAVSWVSTFLIFLGKLAVSAATFGIAWLWLREKNNVEFFAIPLILILLFSWAVASAFFSVLDMTIDTLFLSLALDVEAFNGAHVPEDLKKFVEDNDIKHREAKRREATAA